jgi:sugar/nucleoside kinase (ribokinase family)
MMPQSPSPTLDLLVVGGMTIDRFADGSSTPGGSVIHVARALTARGRTVGVVTAAGAEPEAQRGLAELRRCCALVDLVVHPQTATFRHGETDGRRSLWLEGAGGAVALGPEARDRIRTAAVLYAPIAGEVMPGALRVWDERWPRAAILQGWLRSVATGEIQGRPLGDLAVDLVAALRKLDVLVASRDDLLADADEPHRQLHALRARFGPRPILVVTDGADGLWLDAPGKRPASDWREHLSVPFVVDDPAAVGAGDILAAHLAMRGGRDGDWRDQVRQSMQAVAETLAARR